MDEESCPRCATIAGCSFILGLLAYLIWLLGYVEHENLEASLIWCHARFAGCTYDSNRYVGNCAWTFSDTDGSNITSTLTVYDEGNYGGWVDRPPLSQLVDVYGQVTQIWYDPQDTSDIYLDKQGVESTVNNWRIATIVFACFAAIPSLARVA
jgi:hypothetical protein